MTSVFIFSYYSVKDPVFQSAVLPYFLNFQSKKPFRFILLTWEQKRYAYTYQEFTEFQQKFKENNIIWYRARWHSGAMKLIKKAFDFSYGILLSSWLILRYKASIIYSEGFPGAIIGHFISILTGREHIVHTFEPHAQYMIEAGVWQPNSWEARLLQSLEGKVARRSKAILTATDAMINQLTSHGIMSSAYRVPSCVDLDHYQFSEDHRTELRSKFQISDDEIVLVYIGKFGGMYMEEELFEFFHCCMKSKMRFRFHIYTVDDHQPIHKFFGRYKIPPSRYHLAKLNKAEVPAHLSMADFGLVPVRQYAGKRFCSPIKDGEYWACGLPIIIPEGISDDFEFARERSIGIVLEDTTSSSYEKVVHKIKVWMESQDPKEVRLRCRDFVAIDRNVLHFHSLYADLFSQNT